MSSPDFANEDAHDADQNAVSLLVSIDETAIQVVGAFDRLRDGRTFFEACTALFDALRERKGGIGADDLRDRLGLTAANADELFERINLGASTPLISLRELTAFLSHASIGALSRIFAELPVATSADGAATGDDGGQEAPSIEEGAGEEEDDQNAREEAENTGEDAGEEADENAGEEDAGAEAQDAGEEDAGEEDTGATEVQEEDSGEEDAGAETQGAGEEDAGTETQGAALTIEVASEGGEGGASDDAGDAEENIETIEAATTQPSAIMDVSEDTRIHANDDGVDEEASTPVCIAWWNRTFHFAAFCCCSCCTSCCARCDRQCACGGSE